MKLTGQEKNYMVLKDPCPDPTLLRLHYVLLFNLMVYRKAVSLQCCVNLMVCGQRCRVNFWTVHVRCDVVRFLCTSVHLCAMKVWFLKSSKTL